MTLYHIPDNEQEMNEIYIVLSKDEKGEGICSMMTVHGGMPLIFGHKRMLQVAIDIAKKMQKETGKNIRICKFKKIEIIKEFFSSK